MERRLISKRGKCFVCQYNVITIFHKDPLDTQNKHSGGGGDDDDDHHHHHDGFTIYPSVFDLQLP